MDGYVNVNFFWGGEIVRQDNDVIYSVDPRDMRFVRLGTSFAELRDIVFQAMQISRDHWDVKLCFKYPRLGLANLVTGYFVKTINSDDDVRRMLSIPSRFQMGMGDVSLFIEAESVVRQFEATHSHVAAENYGGYYGGGYGQDYGGQYGGSQSGWSNSFFQTGNSYMPSGEYGGGCSIPTYLSVGQNMVEAEVPATQVFKPRHICRSSAVSDLALGDDFEGDENTDEIPPTSSDDSDWRLSEEDFEDESEDYSEADSGDTREANLTLQMHNTSLHVPRAPWFASEEFNPVISSNEDPFTSRVFDPNSDNLYVGAMFREKDMLVAALKEAHIKTDRNYIVEKSTPKLLKVKCVVRSCNWKLRAAQKKSHGMFEITKCPEQHTCLLDRPSQDHRKISAKMIGSLVQPYVAQTPNLKISNVITMVNDEFKHTVGYMKAWRGKMVAVESIYGNWETTYNELPRFLSVMASTNVGSAVYIDAIPHHTEMGKSTFVRTFWCLKAMIDGWQHARPVISIDGTFLKGKYNGKLLVAVGVDSNNHQYPICFGLVDEESGDNWGWFLRLLRAHVCGTRLGVCIISDRASGIVAAMNDERNGFTPPFGVHRFCLHHVRSNFSKHHPGNELRMLVWLAGRTPQVRKHEAYMKRIGQISPLAMGYLRGIDPEKWTICHDVGNARYGQATTNVTEGFNGNIRLARFLPVTAMMEFLFYKTVRTVNRERTASLEDVQEGHELCLRARTMLEIIIKRANAHRVETFNRQTGLFSVKTQRYRNKGVCKGGNTQVVDISAGTCTCGKWATHRLPCSHLVAGCNHNGINWKQWIGPHHYVTTLEKLWEPMIYPLPATGYWNIELPLQWQLYGNVVPNEALRKRVNKRGQRGQSVRIRTEMDSSRSGHKCSRCKQEGHTKRSRKCPMFNVHPGS